jgi:hypothetical protein
MAKGCFFNPGAGGKKIPEYKHEVIRDRIVKYAEENYSGKFERIDVRFRGKHCYIDAYIEPDDPGADPVPFTGESRDEYMERLRSIPTHLCRLLYVGDDEAWGLAFYTYSNEKYEVSMYPNGSFEGTPEEAFEVGAMYLQ